jgi:MoxR-like ATPase
VYDVALDVMAHRLVLTFDALADGVDPRSVVSRILHTIEQPHVVPADDAQGSAA